jgi:hypothetical protein
MVNIFRLHNDPEIAAKHHADQHVMSGIHETGLMLSAALREHAGWEQEDFVECGIVPSNVYGHSHKGHSLNEWLSLLGNWQWGLDYAEALFDEKVYRWGGGHSTYEDFIQHLPREPDAFEPGTSRMYCAVNDDVEVKSVVITYRRYYIESKGGIDGWMDYEKSRDPPEWLVRSDPFHGLDSEEVNTPAGVADD